MNPYASFYYFGLLLYPTLPAVVLGLTAGLRRWFVLAASLAMLAVTVRNPWLPAAVAVYEWLLLLGLDRARGSRAYQAALVLSLAPLAAARAGAPLGFLGLSYLVLRALDAVVCLHDGVIRRPRLDDYALYLLFFPTFSAGPIDRLRRFAGDWARRRTRAEYLADLDVALRRIAQGFLYKFVLAYLVNRYWLVPAGAVRDPGHMAAYAYAYSLYLFFDFAGYSAFAIGASRIFGVHAPENFDRPFLAANLKEFWNRWHISLSFWLRDHIYMRFALGRWFRSRHLTSYAGIMLAFGFMGLWHGTELHYLVYGAYHGVLLCLEDFAMRWNKRRGLVRPGRLTRWLGVAFNLQVVAFGMLIFSGHWF